MVLFVKEKSRIIAIPLFPIRHPNITTRRQIHNAKSVDHVDEFHLHPYLCNAHEEAHTVNNSDDLVYIVYKS